MPQDFGAVLKDWRNRRRISQLELGLSANVSSRHISFLETGRSRPSRGMVLRLCDELDVPRADRNRMLTSAGLAPVYAGRTPDDTDLAPIRAALRWTMARHDPYPAIALDRHWHLSDMNRAATQVFGAVGLVPGDSMIAALAGNAALRAATENLGEVMHHAIARLRTENAHLGGDPVLDSAIRALQATAPPAPDQNGPLPAVIPARYRFGGAVLSLFSTIAQFGTVEDLALSELRIELFYPADEATAAFFGTAP